MINSDMEKCRCVEELSYDGGLSDPKVYTDRELKIFF